jgi:hypothetical protein
MKCPICNEPLGWQSDCDYSDLGYEGDGIVGMYVCNNVECIAYDIYIYMPLNDDNEKNKSR